MSRHQNYLYLKYEIVIKASALYVKMITSFQDRARSKSLQNATVEIQINTCKSSN